MFDLWSLGTVRVRVRVSISVRVRVTVRVTVRVSVVAYDFCHFKGVASALTLARDV